VGVLTTSFSPDEGSVSPGSAHDQEAGPAGGCCQRGVFELPLRDAVDRRPPGCGADQNSGHGQRSDREDLRREQAEGRRERHLADVDDPEVVATIDDEAAKRWTGGRGRSWMNASGRDLALRPVGSRTFSPRLDLLIPRARTQGLTERSVVMHAGISVRCRALYVHFGAVKPGRLRSNPDERKERTPGQRALTRGFSSARERT